MKIAVAFDGAIVKGKNLKLREGAAETLKALARSHFLILHSGRSSNPFTLALVDLGDPDKGDKARYDEDYLEMKTFLQEHGLWRKEENGVFDAIWAFPGKPDADMYIDDRSRKPNWSSLLETFGK